MDLSVWFCKVEDYRDDAENGILQKYFGKDPIIQYRIVKGKRKQVRRIHYNEVQSHGGCGNSGKLG